MVPSLKTYFGVLKATVKEFIDDNATKLSASLAYYTVFSIGPLLLVMVTVAGLFFKQTNITGRVYHQMQYLVGTQGADQMKSILENISQQNNGSLFGIVGIIVLIFGATGVFVEIQTSINYIWSIKAKPQKGWLEFIRNRLLSFSLIIGIGFLLIVSLLINAIMDALTGRLEHFLGDANTVLLKIISVVLLYLVISVLFAVIYKVLPDATISWRDAFTGSFFTGILFLVGKFLIGVYLGNSQFSSTYGAAASIIIILTWVYYSSIILYFGAEFTKIYSVKVGRGIKPYRTAVFIVKREAKELPESKKDPIHNPANRQEL
ncbi:MAG: YihY/virulence factor BrkB family protein [Bacteroidetes bacterium]|nr:YihY/virulence factor BrkB family protein [Bacteroidota bacterium]